jgi:aspartyl-tRNA(Asn)/glutamyl-tRNA(Gln) amidotransferase subunit A
VNDLLGLTAARQAELIAAGEVSGAEVFEFWRGRAAGDDLGAYLWVAEETPADPGTLPPVAVKDLFCVEGVPSSAGSRILEGHLPVYTATSVRNLQEAGAAVVGKTNQDEFAMGSSNENSGFGPVQNPWDRRRVPGGSSGGSAAAVAAGTAPWAIGTDTGGSVRQPASLCGLVGLKPTYGAVSRHGMIAFASSLDQCSPLTRDVTDAALMLRALEGRDPCDSTSLGLPEPLQLPTAERLDGLRFGAWGLEEEGLEPGVAGAVRATLDLIEGLGGSVTEVDLPSARSGISAYYVIAPAEASATATAPRTSTTCSRCTRTHARRGSARRSSGAS